MMDPRADLVATYLASEVVVAFVSFSSDFICEGAAVGEEDSRKPGLDWALLVAVKGDWIANTRCSCGAEFEIVLRFLDSLVEYDRRPTLASQPTKLIPISAIVLLDVSSVGANISCSQQF